MKQHPTLVRAKNNAKNAKHSSNQAPPGLTPHVLATQPLPPSLLTVLYFWFINGFLLPIVDIV